MKEFEMLGIPAIEWIGYLASTLILISLSLSSILRLRIVNLFGAIVFSIYGFLIGSLPVGIMNLIIVFTNVYYLQKLYSRKDTFEIIETESSQDYVQKFLLFYQKDIQKYFPDFKASVNSKQVVLMIMRNMNLTGLFIANKKDDLLEIELDYVTPQYRDYKNGVFLFAHFRKTLVKKEYKTIVAKNPVPQQIKYLEKMGFMVDVFSENTQNYHLHL